MMNLKQFASENLDGLYNPKFPEEFQGSGWKQLKRMVENQIEPASLEETLRWENYFTEEELLSIPHDKYLRSLHVRLRNRIRKHWNIISEMEI